MRAVILGRIFRLPFKNDVIGYNVSCCVRRFHRPPNHQPHRYIGLSDVRHTEVLNRRSKFRW